MVMLETIRIQHEAPKEVKGEQQFQKVFNKARDAAMKMQRELQWYKEVERMVPSSYILLPNKYGETPSDLFSNYHYNLVKEGEQWMGDTAGSFTIVAALIVTVMFAAAFTLPGGTDENSGNPKFLQRNSFMVFILSDAISLFSSVTAVLMFLSILTSRCTKDDFLNSLPKRLIIGLASLFLSIATMMVTFVATLGIVLGERRRMVVVPIALLASVPVASFVLLQFSLFVDIFSSTYGRGIFNQKTKCSFFNNPNKYVPSNHRYFSLV
ncbi:ankyrin repeat-containing protein NPR4-like [Cornus florida]|uniref:ankyrin repeat-containing protein NPR4-like n=1 Tax=Cornus florida TaxID=4283 RepID=UPI0028A27EE4|nr:ankyrin repeat-containing protein NPR4-like [Cornus florida]XP_059631705.1 ankyrin repeat-containing protein NPR4-like [Cornus florida]